MFRRPPAARATGSLSSQLHEADADSAIPTTANLRSGVAVGTIFIPLPREGLIEAAAAYAAAGVPLANQSLLDVGRRTFIANEIAWGHYLQPGDVVRHGSNYLGDLVVEVVE